MCVSHGKRKTAIYEGGCSGHQMVAVSCWCVFARVHLNLSVRLV